MQRQCELFGHVAVDGSLTVIVVPKRSADVTPLLVNYNTLVRNAYPMDLTTLIFGLAVKFTFRD